MRRRHQIWMTLTVNETLDLRTVSARYYAIREKFRCALPKCKSTAVARGLLRVKIE